MAGRLYSFAPHGNSRPSEETRMTTRRDFLLMCAVASGAPLTSLDPRSAFAADTPKKGGTLRVGFYIEAATMDPHFSGSKIDRQVYHNIYEPLVTLDVKLGIKPGLAESWQQPDSKTVVFKLRRGVKFHDGTDFNAEAARFNFNRMKTEPKSVRKGEVASIDSVDVVDAYTIKINLKRPDAALLATLTDRAGMMVSPRTAQERGPELERNAKGAGTGPFEFGKGVWLNVGVPANGPIPPTSWAYDRSIAPIKRDLARAKAKLAEGGQPNGFTFTMTTNNIPINVQEAEVIQAQLREAGITMKIKLVDSATLIADGNNKSFEMISFQWSGRPDPDGNTYQFYKTTPGTSFNWSGISNPQIDALLDRSREVSSQAERKKLFSDLTRILQDELPNLFIVHPIEPKAFSPKVQGYEPIPDGMMRFKDVWLA